MDPQNQTTSSKPQIPMNPQAPITQVPIVDPAKDLEELTKDPVPTLADEVKAFEDQQNQQPSAKSASSNAGTSVTPGGKEMPPTTLEMTTKSEVASEVEVIPEQADTKEVEGYMEQVEKFAETQHTVTDDYTNQVLMAPANPQNVVVTLPMTADDIKKGLHHQVWEGVRWLAEWCVRQIKVLHGRVRFKK